MKPKKPKYLKSEFSEDNYKDFILFAESTGLPYTLTETNYTITITSDFCNVKFAPTMQKSAFIAGAMVKKDIISTGLEPPDFEQESLKYFDFAPTEELVKDRDRMYNIDIKSAYASVLFNHGLISTKTRKYMAQLSKRNRLACVGMLASRKDHYQMIGKEVIEKSKEVNSMSNWFYFCVNRTNEIMMKCKEIAGDSFLFFWVDGIFLSDYSKVKPVSDYLRSIGYKYSFDLCTNVKYSQQNNVSKLRYNKGEEVKELFLPKKNKEIDTFLINFLSL
jgi:hypothetical protein